MAILLAWGCALLAVMLAYWIAGDIWVRRHSLRFNVGSSEVRWSGAVGEMLIVTFAAALVIIIDLASPGVSLDEAMLAHPTLVAGVFGFVALVVYIHGYRTAWAAERDERVRLAFTYTVYGVYSLVVFAVGAMLIYLLLDQFRQDFSLFSETSGSIIARLDQLEGASTTDQATRILELSYLDTQKLLASTEQSMSPVFILMAGIFSINLAVRLTPLRALFINNAVLLTQLSTLVGLLAVLVAGGWVYVGSYTTFLDTFIGRLDSLEEMVSQEFPGTLSRYSEIYLDAVSQKSLVGFITRMSNEWGGLAAILGIAQWVARQFARPEAEESAAHKPRASEMPVEG